MLWSEKIVWFDNSVEHPSGIVINFVFLILSGKYEPLLHIIWVLIGTGEYAMCCVFNSWYTFSLSFTLSILQFSKTPWEHWRKRLPRQLERQSDLVTWCLSQMNAVDLFVHAWSSAEDKRINLFFCLSFLPIAIKSASGSKWTPSYGSLKFA